MSVRRMFGQFGMAVLLVGYLAGGSFAAPITYPSGTKVLIVDGDSDSNTTVTPTITSMLGDFTFGHVDGGGTFAPIVSGVTALGGGSFVDFAIKDNTTMAVSSLTTPNFAVITGTFDTEIAPGSAQEPSPLTGSYFNTLFLTWSVGGIDVSTQFLNAGANNDGFQPVPIPTTMLLFGTGLLGLIGITRRTHILKKFF